MQNSSVLSQLSESVVQSRQVLVLEEVMPAMLKQQSQRHTQHGKKQEIWKFMRNFITMKMIDRAIFF